MVDDTDLIKAFLNEECYTIDIINREPAVRRDMVD